MRYVTLFTLAYLTAGLVMAWRHLNYEFAYYGIMVGLQIALFVHIDRRVAFSPLVLWGLAVWGLLHFGGGLLPIPESLTEAGRPATLYNLRPWPWFPKFDQIVHAYGFGMTVILCYEALSVRLKQQLAIDSTLAAMLFLSAMGLGAVNEVIEFTAVLLMPETNVGGYENTGWDLVSNGLGALMALSYLKWVRPC